MLNKEPRCVGCIYNTAKRRGGLGKICNGYTMTNYNRCPEWRIREAQQLKQALLDAGGKEATNGAT